MVAKRGGCPTVIVSGEIDNVIHRVANGELLGTLLTTNEADKMIAKKQWLAAHLRMMGRIVVDDGAVNALVNNGKSLLLVGVTEIQGDFDEGDVVECVDSQGIKTAVGQVSLSAKVAKELLGNKENSTSQVILHRDNLALI